MADVRFEVHHRFDSPPRAVWDDLVDWEAHADWVPMTRMEVPAGDQTAVGYEFTATTGLGPLAMPDRMRVTQCDWHDDAASGVCEVEKLGPVLRGTAGFTVEPDGDGTTLVWIEDVTVPYSPQFLAPVFAKLGAAGFRQGMKRLAKQVRARA